MRIIRFNPRGTMAALEAELDRVAEKHDIEPRLRTMPLPEIFDHAIGYDWEDDDEEDY